MRIIDKKIYKSLENIVDAEGHIKEIRFEAVLPLDLRHLPKLLSILPRNEVYIAWYQVIDNICAEQKDVIPFERPSNFLAKLTYFQDRPAEQGGDSVLCLCPLLGEWFLFLRARDLVHDYTMSLHGSKEFLDTTNLQLNDGI